MMLCGVLLHSVLLCSAVLPSMLLLTDLLVQGPDEGRREGKVLGQLVLAPATAR
jgi:hypothetical protein